MNNYECVFEGCTRKAVTKVRGLCAGHEWQRKNGHNLHPLKQYNTSDIGVEGYRLCTRCKKVKEDTEFYRRKDGRLRGHCKRCAIDMVQASKKARQEAQNGD